MWDLLEVFGYFALIPAFLLLMEFWDDPEETSERLGRCVRAFRRGLSGQTAERSTEQVSESKPQ